VCVASDNFLLTNMMKMMMTVVIHCLVVSRIEMIKD